MNHPVLFAWTHVTNYRLKNIKVLFLMRNLWRIFSWEWYLINKSIVSTLKMYIFQHQLQHLTSVSLFPRKWYVHPLSASITGENPLCLRELESCIGDPRCVASVHRSLASHWVQQHAWSPKQPHTTPHPPSLSKHLSTNHANSPQNSCIKSSI